MTTEPTSLRSRAYQREIRVAQTRGATPEGVRDCLLSFGEENPSPSEFSERLRHYIPAPRERATFERETAA
jgi:hypothetical protein